MTATSTPPTSPPPAVAAPSGGPSNGGGPGAIQAFVRTHGGIVAFVLALAVTGIARFVLPNDPPNGILLDGAINGMRHAMLAGGLILIWRSSQIINFSQAALGAAGATLVFNLSAIGIAGVGKMPFFVSFLVAVIVTLVIGLAIELVFVRRFFTAPRLVLTVVTVVAAPTIASLSQKVNTLAVWEGGQDIIAIREQTDYRGPFGSLAVEVFPITFGFPEVFTIILTVGSFAALALFLRRSRLGAAVRGASENADRALLLGVNVKLLSTLVWGIAAMFSCFAAVSGGLDNGFRGSESAPGYLLVPLAAVVLGRMVSMPQTVIAAVMLGLLDTALSWAYPGTVVFDGLVLVVVVLGLYMQRSTYSRTAAATSWKATQEVRPTPKELLALPGLRFLRRGLAVAAVAFVVIYPQTTSASQSELASRIAINVIIALSLVVLTGWGGQISLGQFGLVAVGVLIGGKLTADFGLPFWLAIPAVGVVVAAAAAGIGQPALRIRGPFLAVSTLAFAVAVEKILFNERLFGWLQPSETIERPSLLFVSFASERSYFYLCAITATLAALAVRKLRASRTGRVLIAIREDEYGVQPFGINAGRARLAVFALAGMLAGLAGVLLIHQSRSTEIAALAGDKSIDAFVMVMIGGVSSVSGAVLGALYTGITGFLIADEQLRRLSNTGGLLALLFLAPGGLSSVFYAARDNILRIVATRRRIVVPSLFADYDADATAKQKVVLGPPLEGRGLEALPAERRWRLRSAMYPVDRHKPAPVPGASK